MPIPCRRQLLRCLHLSVFQGFLVEQQKILPLITQIFAD